MKFSFSRFLILSIATTLLIPYASAQVVNIPDPNLNQAVREALELPDENAITQQDMARLTKWGAIDRGITDITGIEYAINLKELLLNFNQIQDITPLAGLVNLELLGLVHNRIADLTPLANLTKLKYLYLGSNGIKDITVLSNLTQLRVLDLTNCQISDITPLSNLIQLERLEISWNKIVNISPLANLIQLQVLEINANHIVDFSPLQGLSLTKLKYDEVCLLPDPPIQDRIGSRSLPSTMTSFNHRPINLPMLSYLDGIAYHDMYWTHLPFDLRFRQGPPWSQLIGDIDGAIAQREELLSKNPNMLFLAELRIRNAHLDVQYPEDWFGWLRDENGNLLREKPRSPTSNLYAIDLRIEEVQDLIVEQAISVSKCGLYDGIMFDTWGDTIYILTGLDQSGVIHVQTPVDRSVRLSIIQRIREAVPDDFLVLCNVVLDAPYPTSYNWEALPLSASYINGGFIEVHHDTDTGYSDEKLAEIEGVLLWLEANVVAPQLSVVGIKCLKL